MLYTELTTAEILKLSTEILSWELPLTMTAARLESVKSIATSALTQTHNHLKDPFKRLERVVIKPKISIADLVKLNRYDEK